MRGEMDLSYEIVYSEKRKKVAITVERDRSVVVRAPLGTTEEKVRAIVDSKKQWILKKINHPQKYDALLHPPGKELVSGESMLYLGREYRLELEDELETVQFSQNRFHVPRKKANERYTAFLDWYRMKAEEKIIPRIEEQARSLGVEYNRAEIVDNRFRWGSCTPKDNVTINWRLIKAPMFVIDYVVVHELAHLLEPNHSPQFWSIIKTRLTHVEKAKTWLKDHGALLEQSL